MVKNTFNSTVLKSNTDQSKYTWMAPCLLVLPGGVSEGARRTSYIPGEHPIYLEVLV